MKTLILDVLVAKEVWVGTEPEVRVYDTAANGKADPNDPTRDIDIMPQADGSRCISMGTDIEQFRCAMIPQYAQMLNSVINAHGWSGSTFRGYRCQIEYPLYSSQVTLVFDPFRRA